MINIIFSVYLIIVVAFWIYILILLSKKYIYPRCALVWLVAGTNLLGITLFFVFKHRFVLSNSSI